jgi:Rrf2 family protein
MIITRATEYAIRSLIYMAGRPWGIVVTKRDICKTQGVTSGFLIKIFQPLVKKGILKSVRGVKGGFYLARQADAISILDVVEAVEGPAYLNKCLTGAGACERQDDCPIYPVWKEAREKLENILRRSTLAKLARRKLSKSKV